MDLYCSPSGKDSWSGRLPEPNELATDGPFATLGRARDEVRKLKASAALDGPLTVHLRGGVYPVNSPLEFGPDDSAPVTFAAWRDEQPILDGGRRLTGWRVEPVNGREAWVVDLPELVLDGSGAFRQLFVNGQRRPRAGLPKEGFYWIESAPDTPLTAGLFEGSCYFVAAEGDIKPWQNLNEVEVVLYHFWIEERSSIYEFDEASRLVTLWHDTTFCLKDDFRPRYARYRVENVFEALTEPGEWYLDTTEARLYYLPLPGEDPATAEVVAPGPTQLLRLVGQPEAGRYVDYLRFEGLTFRYADWEQPSSKYDHGPREGQAIHNSYQGAFLVPGVIYLEGARWCAIEDCRVEHVGWYGIELADGCQGNRIVGNELTDLGAGGVKLNGSDAAGPPARRTAHNRVTDNHIHHGGEVFASATGILCRHSGGNVLSHNHIHDLYYSGISVGWVWGYGDNVAKDNRVEYNHIHDLGHGLLSDMGGIYTLGVQPGTVLRYNHIHDVTRHNYGGWAIYPDEGSSHILIEHNVCYRTDSQVFHQHYGRENVVRNNIFAFGGEAAGRLSRPSLLDQALHLERNLWVTDGAPVFNNGAPNGIYAELNLYYDYAGPARFQLAGQPEPVDFETWQAHGVDRHGMVADPGFRDPARGDFSLQEGSAALALGFEPIDLSNVGPRPPEQRE
ncbi:MAG: right-handed parallel beta-helix repeat-containing protein [Armatimonadetes bacterium]|nr:right-handed parallel beta-helix repeat-containing protein [Armatimonadota bacterium]